MVPRPAMSTALFIVALGVATADVSAQYALGTGGAHDRNLSTGGNGRNYPKAVENFMARNAVVTGDVTGGREFRGEVGYTSPFAFRGVVGSDAIFPFRADSALSSLPAVVRGLTNSRFSQATTQAPITFERDTTPTNPIPAETRNERRRDPIDARTVIENGAILGNSSRIIQQSWGGSMVGNVQDATGRTFAVVGSPVTGLRYEPRSMGQMQSLDVGLYDRRRIVEDDVTGRSGTVMPGAPFPRFGQVEEPATSPSPAPREDAAAPRSDRIDLTIPGTAAAAAASGMSGPTGDATAPAAQRIDKRVDHRVGMPDYDAIVRDLVDRYKADPNVRFDGDAQLRSRLREDLDRLGDELSGRRAPRAPGRSPVLAPAAAGGAGESTQESKSALPGGALTPGATNRFGPDSTAPAPEGSNTRPGGRDKPASGALDAGAEGGGDAAEGVGAAAAGPNAPLNIDQLASLLRHNTTIQDLSPEQRTRIDELIARGQSELAAGDYFLAEQSFERALVMMPGHPMATAGVINAEIAAGLHLAAAIRLRRFFADSPEMIAARYAPRLLPTRERFDVAVENIHRRMAIGADQAEFGLVLAYIGRHTDNAALIREGLDAIVGTPANDTLRKVLKRVWLDE